ncbi:MAG: hypothetical protein HY913_04560 [Desulfomonile tiedjei]|nr:hypothetical protein [Desulfomonile tiedjei]
MVKREKLTDEEIEVLSETPAGQKALALLATLVTDKFISGLVDDVAQLIRVYLDDDPEKPLDVDELLKTDACKTIMCFILCNVANNLVAQGKLEMREEGGKGHYQCYLKK